MGKAFLLKTGRAFTLVELIATIAIVAILVAVMVPTVGYFVDKAAQTADRQTLSVLNTAINRYKTQGGDVSALTAGKHYSHLLEALRTPVLWNGLSHQFLRGNDSIFDAATSLQATGDGRDYKITAFGSYTDQEGGSDVDTGQYFLLNEGAEGVGIPAGWSVNNGGAINWDYSSSPIEGSESLYVNGSSFYSPYATIYSSSGFPASNDWWLYFRLWTVIMPTDRSDIILVKRGSDDNTQFQLRISPTAFYMVNHNGIANVGTASAAADTLYHVWIHYDYDTAVAYVSTNGIRPASPQTTVSVSYKGVTGSIYFGASRNADMVYDHILISDSPIGDNPQ